jgi:hypothetical protein
MRFSRLPFRVTHIFAALASFFVVTVSARSMTGLPGAVLVSESPVSPIPLKVGVVKKQVEAISISNALRTEDAGRAAKITNKQFEP